jgi:hypothetical protein
MAPEAQFIEISLLSGQSDRPILTFTPGTPANPVSVGGAAAAQWSVLAEGVSPIHLYIVFDGRSVHVAAAAPTAQVLLAGAPVGVNWARAPVPCELRFGGACVIMRYAARQAYPVEEQTVHDGGALWHAAQQAVRDAIGRAQQGPPPENAERTIAMPGAMPGVSGTGSEPPRPAAGSPAPFASTLPLLTAQEVMAKAQSSFPPPPNAAPLSPIPPGDDPPTMRAPFGPGQVPRVSAPNEATAIAPQPLVPRQGGSPFAFPTAGPLPPGASGAFGSSPPPANTPARVPLSPADPARAMNTAPGERAEPAKAPGYWQSASMVKKITLVLMPFALGLSYFMLVPEPPAPPAKVVPGAGASAKRAAQARDSGAAEARAAGAAGSVTEGGAPIAEVTADAGGANEVPDQPSAAVVSPVPDNAPKMAPLPRGARTPERQALDAVAAGSFDEASKLYTTLAASHPDDPSYKEAARILREKTGQTRGNAP